MVPSALHPTWARLIRGEIDHKFSVTGAGLLFFSLKQQFMKEPKGLPQQIDTARQFFEKYESILSDDMKKLF